MKGELCGGGGGANSISTFDHHNINGGAVSKIHDVTGRRLVSSISTHEISMLVALCKLVFFSFTKRC
jgi:PIN domain nuclease of toxin-antitoxin system